MKVMRVGFLYPVSIPWVAGGDVCIYEFDDSDELETAADGGGVIRRRGMGVAIPKHGIAYVHLKFEAA